jgi:adenine deaminase
MAMPPPTPPSAGVERLQRRIRVALGQEPGDLVLRGGEVVNVFTGTTTRSDVVIADGWIAGVGPYDWQAGDEIRIEGRVVIPSLIDAHVHVESTMLAPAELARLVVPRGTGTLVADPHEIANVMGVRGVEMLIDAGADAPLDIYYMAPSCVPALPWENAGAVLDAEAVRRLLENPAILGLAEMMNFPGARGAVVDGHAPGVTGRDLVAYAAAGIRSDHESTDADEAAAKAAMGMLVQVREGSSARNLDTMLPLMAEGRLGAWCFCTDDIHPDDLIADGHIDGLLRRAVAAGVAPETAVRHATLVPARHYGLHDRGAVTPSRRADLLVVDDLASFTPLVVIKDGRVVAQDGVYLPESNGVDIPCENTVHLAELDESAFSLRVGADPVDVIGIVGDQIVTRHERRTVGHDDGRWCFDPGIDVVLIANLERHRATGNVGLGLVEGFGFSGRGAIGSSVAHDAHNLIIAGTNPADMLACARALAETGGGFVVAADGAVKARLALPVAGLISDQGARDVCRQLEAVRGAARALGCGLACPFGTLSFLALSVIPALRITDQGLFDVVNQEFIAVA